MTWGYKNIKITKRQRQALVFLRDDKEYGDLVYEKGSGWWLGSQKTNGKLALNLIRMCLVSEKELSDAYVSYRINESGLRTLVGKKPYRMSDGTYVNSLAINKMIKNLT